MGAPDYVKRAKAKYRKEKMGQITVYFYPGDAEIYQYVSGKENKAGYIRDLIRADMERCKEKQ